MFSRKDPAYHVTLLKSCPGLEPICVRVEAQIDESKTVTKRGFEPIRCPQVQIGRDNVSASAIAASTNNATINQAKTPHVALQAASCFWKQNVELRQVW